MKRHIPRRNFLADVGMGFTGLALGAMLNREGIARAATTGAFQPPNGKPHFAPKAKRVIWLFMIGGVSHMDTFDPKPALNKYGGRFVEDTPYKDALDNPLVKKNLREVIAGLHHNHPLLYPMQVGYSKRGQSGIEVSDWWPHVSEIVDDIAVVRSMWTTDNNHGAQMQFHTGRHGIGRPVSDHRVLGALWPGITERQPAAVCGFRRADRHLLRRIRCTWRGVSRAGTQRRAVTDET